MQPYDFLMIAVLVGLTLYGYSKGMAWQVAYLASLFASYFVARQFADQFAPMFGQSAPLNKFVAMLVIYIATSFVIWMLFRVVHGAIDKVKMEGFDHQMGALIGF
ncbi:MAG: CvpA family protein, partial [Planctomycetales bacterium]|nr:CvpA family protein [Planctomycetales bacterium]